MEFKLLFTRTMISRRKVGQNGLRKSAIFLKIVELKKFTPDPYGASNSKQELFSRIIFDGF